MRVVQQIRAPATELSRSNFQKKSAIMVTQTREKVQSPLTREIKKMLSQLSHLEVSGYKTACSISGIDCTVSADHESGFIHIEVNSSLDCKCHKLDIRPNMGKHTKKELHEEVQRLYFQVDTSSTKCKLILQAREDYHENPHWVIKIRGNPLGNKYANIKFTREHGHVVLAELSLNDKTYALRLHPTTVGDLNKEKGKHYLIDLQYKSFEELSTYISANFTVFQVSEEWSELKLLSEVEQKKIRKMKWMKKIENGCLKADELESVIAKKATAPVIIQGFNAVNGTTGKKYKDKSPFRDDLSSVMVEEELSVSDEGSLSHHDELKGIEYEDSGGEDSRKHARSSLSKQ